MTVVKTGYIVANDMAIYGVGATADEAWADWKDEMDKAGIVILSEEDDDEDEERNGSYTRESEFYCQPATAALMQKVKDQGGNIAFGEVNGVACTKDEEDEAA